MSVAIITRRDCQRLLAPRPPSWQTNCTFCGAHVPDPHPDLIAWIADGLCQRCWLRLRAARIEKRGQTAEMGNAIIPLRAAEDPAIPVRWRVYLRLQLLGAALDWTPVLPGDLAAHFGVHPQTVYRALWWLVRAGYVEQRVIAGKHGGRPHAWRVVIDEHPSAA